jgi:hypothetical protein
MIGTCRLCERARPLRLSHISPKFVYRFQRATSPTTIRSHLTPNRAAQDSRKLRFLCEECETLFSAWESQFARRIYAPYQSGELQDVVYGPWLMKFAVSVSWRAIKATLEAGDRLPDELVDQVSRAERAWRDFLLDRTESPGPFEQHIFLLDPLAQTSDSNLPINFAFYIKRVAANGIWHHPPRFTFAFTMMCSIAVIGVISAPSRRKWRERIRLRGGVIRTRSLTVFPKQIIQMIVAQARDHLAMSRELSDRQKERDREQMAGEERFLKSGYARAMAIDAIRGAGAPIKDADLIVESRQRPRR